MKEKKYIDGLHYELRNAKYDSKENLVSAEIYAQANEWNSNSDSSARMMNRICHHLDSELKPDYCRLNEHLGLDKNGKRFVRELLFIAEKPIS